MVLGWVLFRAASLGDAADFYAAMLSFDTGPLPAALDDALERAVGGGAGRAGWRPCCSRATS